MRTSATKRIRRLAAPVARRIAGDQSGFTLIEVIIAVSVLSTGIMSMVMAFDTSRKLSLVSERSAAMAHAAQKEIERIEGLPYAVIGMSAAPSTSASPTNPDYYVGSNNTFEWDRTAGSSESLNVDTTTGQVTPLQSWSEGQLGGSIYDFITWTSDPKCSPGCPASQDYKRITVAVTMASGLHPNPVYVSSVIADPAAEPVGGISNGNANNPLTDPTTKCNNTSGQVVACQSPIDSGNPNTFYLHDCAATNSSCPLPSVSNVTHQTLGIASGLLCTTSPLLATILSNITGCPTPDLMDGTPPSGGGSNPTCYQYSTDQSTSGYPCGTLIQPSCANNTLCTGGSGCNGNGCSGGSSNPPSTSDCSNQSWSGSILAVQSHFWVSSPLTASETLTGDAGISMFTQTQNSVSSVVAYCVEIYDVPPSNGVAGSLSDLLAWPPVALGGAGYVAATDPSTGGNWPQNASQVAYIFNFRGSNGTVSIAAGHRLGVRIWMKASVNAAIDLIYDNPLYPTQVQLNTQ